MATNRNKSPKKFILAEKFYVEYFFFRYTLTLLFVNICKIDFFPYRYHDKKFVENGWFFLFVPDTGESVS